jgi:serine/threonine-protein kinase HipA
MLFFNYLTASPDAHAKNYSLLHPAPGICELAPLYDAASALPYDPAPASPHYPLHNSLYNPQHDPAPERVQHQAMPIGRENRVGHVGREDIACFADTAQMDRERCVDLMAGLCERIIKRASEAADDALAPGADGADELVERLLPRLESHCRATLRRL